MPIQQTIPYEEGPFFITFTCHKWINLIDITGSYDLVYKWFDHLKSKGHKIIGCVIMPNHIHVLIDFIKTHQTINLIIGNGKRFMAYDIIKRLKEAQQHKLINFKTIVMSKLIIGNCVFISRTCKIDRI